MTIPSSKIRRWSAIAGVIWAGAQSGWTWTKGFLFGPSVEEMRAANAADLAAAQAAGKLPPVVPPYPEDEIQDRERMDHYAGFFAPGMLPIWDEYFNDPSYHHHKNVGSEWVRTDDQRGFKLGSMAFVAMLFVAGFLLLLLIGVAGAWAFFG